MFIAWTFFAFVIFSLAIYWILPPRLRLYFLTVASAGYFALYYPRDILFLAVLSCFVYLLGKAISRGSSLRSWLTVLGVVILVGVLGYFKYAKLMLDTVRYLAHLAGNDLTLSLPRYFVPLGISYFTFKMISYLVDLKKGKIPEHKVIDFFLYIFFFPILISGPIERFQPFLQQSAGKLMFDREDFYYGVLRIGWGLFKKVVLADTLALISPLLNQQGLTTGYYWLGSLAYTFQLYLDFSGYSDMAIGISRLFGYRIIENFNRPYLAPDLSQFWKRWHMSLTGWFRDYLFIPLGGSRGSFSRTILNTWIVMAVTGLWHGAAWHFVLWGLYHACGLTALRVYRRYIFPRVNGWLSLDRRAWVRYANIALTFAFVNIGWVFFACDAKQGMYVVRHMFGL